MRVLFTSWGQSGHYQPLVPLGWALQAAGHEVAVLSNSSFAPTVSSSGLTAVPVGPDINVSDQLRVRFADSAAASPDLLDNWLGRPMMTSVLESCFAMLDDALEFAGHWRPDLVVYEPAGLLGPVLATVRRLPSVRVLWGPDFMVGMRTVSRELFGPDFLARFGLADVDVTGDTTLDPCPPRMRTRDDLTHQPMRYIGYPGPLPTAPGLLDKRAGRPRVCITWGTTCHDLGLRDSYRAPDMVCALSTLDVDIVLAVPQRELREFGELPTNVIHAGPVALRTVLPTCDAVLHQAGAGTTMTSIMSGVPQLVMPDLRDAVFTAEQLLPTGVGIRLSPEADATEVARQTETLLTEPAYAQQARLLRAEAAAMPAPSDLVPLLT
jgi:UDP:flavonoid glycosyltransferase YjiC (YdhE family)